MAKVGRIMAVGVAVAAATAALGVGQAGAGLLGCSYAGVGQPFVPWGDYASYTLVPGGSFEGNTGWELGGGAAVVTGNESFYVTSGGDARSLALPYGGSGQAPAACITGTDLSVRLFARTPDAAPLRVDVMVPGLFGLLRVATTFSVATSTSWQPTRTVVNLADVLSLTSLSSSNLVLRFAPTGAGGAQIDDVYVDPMFHD